MMAACKEYIQGQFHLTLKEAVKEKFTGKEGLSWDITIDPSASDGQALLFKYPQAGLEYGYVTPAVKIELGSRADFWPVEKHTLNSYVAIQYPDLFSKSHVMVTTLSPVRTFWEKTTILHEEAFRPEGNFVPRGYSRHYYDIYMKDNAGITQKALLDIDLKQRVVEHKTLFYKRSWSRYDLAVPGSFKLIPSDKTVSELKKDYILMEPMIFRTLKIL